jgi:hypothetical protein
VGGGMERLKMSGITHITVDGHRIEIGDSKFECEDMEAFRKSQV